MLRIFSTSAAVATKVWELTLADHKDLMNDGNLTINGRIGGIVANEMPDKKNQ